MDLEQHIKNLKDYIRIDKDNINYDDSDFAQFCKGHCEDIQAVLNELDNRIPRKDIEEMIKGLDRNIASVKYNQAENYKYAKRILEDLENKE